MNKLEINLSKDMDEDSKYLSFPECCNIINQFDYDSINLDNVVKAIDFIIAYFYKYRIYCSVADIHIRNSELAPKKKMTKTEIEKALGYAIEIVEEETEND